MMEYTIWVCKNCNYYYVDCTVSFLKNSMIGSFTGLVKAHSREEELRGHIRKHPNHSFTILDFKLSYPCTPEVEKEYTEQAITQYKDKKRLERKKRCKQKNIRLLCVEG